jgi:hypothetical protein
VDFHGWPEEVEGRNNCVLEDLAINVVAIGESLSSFKVSPKDFLKSYITLIIVERNDEEERNLVEEGIFAFLEAGCSPALLSTSASRVRARS